MPIKSAADKIIREMEMFGPEFDQEPAPVEEVRTLAELLASQSS